MDDILKILRMNNWYNSDQYVQIAKGKYELALTHKERVKKMKTKFKIFFTKCRELKRMDEHKKELPMK